MFDIARRGYDRDQVDAYVADLADTAAETATAPPEFQLARRGYDRAQVDAYVQEALRAGAPPPSPST